MKHTLLKIARKMWYKPLFFGAVLAEERRGLSEQEALTKTMRILALPVILTSITTALGFISLISAPGISIKNMGIFLAFGVMVAMVFSLCFIPALTSFYRKKITTPAPSTGVIFLLRSSEIPSWV